VQVLTFDFHNTLANCDRWFHLEIRDLPWAVMDRLDLTSGHEEPTIAQSYRDLRLAVIESGNEIDAPMSVGMILNLFGINAKSDDIVRVIDELMREAIDETVPVPGAAETVRQLHDSGVKLGVVSSAVHHQTLVWILERMNILTCFDSIVTSASCGYYKSTPRIYAAALAELNGNPQHSVHVGDSLRWDVETAQLAGLHTVWLQTPRREVFSTGQPEVSPSLTLTSLEGSSTALLELLAKVGQT
jgi:HAD superfamily hydrolase (TIGR01509 family)